MRCCTVKTTARRLFITDQVSISRLERYAGCPYRHFIDYGLRPVHRETFEFEDSDAGTFFHAALDGYMRKAAGKPEWPDFSREQAERVMDDVLRELTEEWAEGPLQEDAIGVWQGETLDRRVRYAAWALTRFADARPAGALYFPVSDKEIETRETDPEIVEEKRLSQVRMKGLVTADADVVRAMDRDRTPFSVDQVFNKDGSVSKKAPWAVDEGILQGLMDAAEAKAAELCDGIRDGRVEAAPSGDGKENVCAWCDYRTICHTRPEDERLRNGGATWQSLARNNSAQPASDN